MASSLAPPPARSSPTLHRAVPFSRELHGSIVHPCTPSSAPAAAHACSPNLNSDLHLSLCMWIRLKTRRSCCCSWPFTPGCLLRVSSLCHAASHGRAPVKAPYLYKFRWHDDLMLEHVRQSSIRFLQLLLPYPILRSFLQSEITFRNALIQDTAVQHSNHNLAIVRHGHPLVIPQASETPW